jgi:predicted O-methyltransferase YrrM
MEAGALALTGAVMAALGVVTTLLRRIDRWTRSEHSERRAQAEASHLHLKEGASQLGNVARRVTDALAELRGSVGEDRIELLIRLEQITERLDQVGEQLGQSSEQVRRLRAAMEELPTSLKGTFAKATDAAIARSSRDTHAKIQAHADLHRLITPRAPMPLQGGWALASDTMHAVASRVWDARPELIVECGSGSSSVWLGYIVELLGLGQVISLEHDQRYFEASRDLVRAHGLEKVVEIRYAPFEAWTDGSGADHQWYALMAIEDLANIGLLLVDGPPGPSGHQARYPAGPLLFPRCREGAVVVLDDADREDEKAISDRWLADWPNLTRTPLGRATAEVFTLGSEGASTLGDT